MLIGLLKNMQQPTTFMFCHCWTAMLGNNSFSKTFGYAKYFMHSYWTQYVCCP